MKPQNLIALLLFLGGAVWALTRNEVPDARSKAATTWHCSVLELWLDLGNQGSRDGA
ncbi:MAG: hypothetical protein QM755_24980 [Luteolibacter sp.]